MWRVRCDLLQSVADGGVLRLRVVATMSARLATWRIEGLASPGLGWQEW